MAYDVFISYSRRDMSVIDKFVKGLTDAGYTVWIDRTGVSGGNNFGENIVQAIEQSAVVLFFSSSNSNASEWTIDEVFYSLSQKKIVIPIRLDDTEFNANIRMRLLRSSYISCDPNQPLSSLEELVAHIANHIGRRKPTSTSDASSKAGKTTDDNSTPKELYSLGYSYYEKGYYEQAVNFFRQAAELGHDGALSMIGFCYYNGIGVARDYSEAVKWFRKSAEQGNAFAQFHLGCSYENGQGVSRDYGEAMKWYRKAADQGNILAQNMLGFCYENGRRVSRDYGEAVKWYRKAAEQGDAYALCNLGFCYEKGEGVAKDIDEAVKWYRKAAEQGQKDAIKALKRLGK